MPAIAPNPIKRAARGRPAAKADAVTLPARVLQILSTAPRGLSAVQIKLELPKDSLRCVKNALTKLKRSAKVEQAKYGLWRLTAPVEDDHPYVLPVKLGKLSDREKALCRDAFDAGRAYEASLTPRRSA